LFVTLNGKSAWKQTDVGRSFRYYKNKSGITKHFTLHTLRHTSATQLAIKGAPMNVIQKILGHSKLETTVKFYIGAVDNDTAKKLMRDEHFRIIPQELIHSTTSQNPNIAGVPSSPVPYQPQGSIYR
jgi:site-specific recombinase XerD